MNPTLLAWAVLGPPALFGIALAADYWRERYRRTHPRGLVVAYTREDGTRVMMARCHRCGAHVASPSRHAQLCARGDAR